MRRRAELSSPPGGELDQMAGPAGGFLKGAGESEVTEVERQAWMRFDLRC